MLLKNVAIVGPTGNVGSAIIKHILASGNDSIFHVTAIVRPGSTRPPPPASDKITLRTADFASSASLTSAFQGQDALVCCVPGGATSFGPQKLMIDAAVAAGVKLFFASEFISDILSPHFAIFPPEYVGDKIKVRCYLEEMAAAGKIAWTALNGGPFFDMWLMKGPAGFNIPARTATIYGSGNCPACWTPVPVAAAAAVNMLRNPEPILNRCIFISGVKDVTQLNILAALEAETGEKFKLKYVDLEPLKTKAMQDLAKKNYQAAVRGLALNSNFNEKDSYANFWHMVENELVGVEPVTVREAVRAATKADVVSRVLENDTK